MPSCSQPETKFDNTSVRAYNGSQTSDHTDAMLKREKDQPKPQTSLPQTSAEKQQDFAGIGFGAESTWFKR
ncbi:hypothetical protein ASPWEDRAFT_43936 [Aspergillus wentii DTO 134E9]|uniref:Uncharacterized protein n=1 Tax=Aspergillus wentii DTO 134E9 TaxID=1073089 RepID=A0A1L9RAG7_ASPWE|nr:uncharacterized protein ASPWEDRAFT_43936 [Aspergillus wentii DTO 134E9]OJJ31912.1 hypothetical protein ASPWEDRAFT_43936 [Aspergillus wentii DTO 134E9]